MLLPNGQQQGMQTLGLNELHQWLLWQQTRWLTWAEARDPSWLALPTGNPMFPTLGAMFAHAFTPLHRYADYVLGTEPAEAPPGVAQDWAALQNWAQRCLERSASAIPVACAEPRRQVHFRTRSSGILAVTAELALAHSMTHCFWHLGGIAHLLRAAGIEPPHGSDLVYWGLAQSQPA